MADIEVKLCSVLPTYRDSRQVSVAQVLANCSREIMLKLLGSGVALVANTTTWAHV